MCFRVIIGPSQRQEHCFCEDSEAVAHIPFQRGRPSENDPELIGGECVHCGVSGGTDGDEVMQRATVPNVVTASEASPNTVFPSPIR